MRKMFITEIHNQDRATEIGICVPEDIIKEDVEGFAQGVAYVLKKLDDSSREQSSVIRYLGDSIKYI